MSAFVTGFPGYIARRVATRLSVDKNLPVKLLVAPEHKEEAEAFVTDTGADIDIIIGSCQQIDFGLSGPQFLELASQVSAIFYLVLPQPPGHHGEELNAPAVARELVELARAAKKPPHILVLSHVDVAGNLSGQFTEQDLEMGQTFGDKAQENRVRLERILRRFMSELPITVARTGWIAGQGHGLCPLGYLLLSMDDPSSLAAVQLKNPLYIVDPESVVGALVGLTEEPAHGGRTLHLIPAELPLLEDLLYGAQEICLTMDSSGHDLQSRARRALRKDEALKYWSARDFFKKHPSRALISSMLSQRVLSKHRLTIPSIRKEFAAQLIAESIETISEPT